MRLAKKILLMKTIMLLAVFAMIHSVNGQDALSLREAVSYTLQNNYSILISENEVRQGSLQNHIGEAGFLPTIDLNANKNWRSEDIDLLFLNEETLQRDGARTEALIGQALLSWNIFDGTRMFITKDKLYELEMFGEEIARVTIENTIAALATTYYGIVAEAERLRVFEEAVALSEKRLELAKSNYEVGRGNKMDYLSAQVDLNTDKSALAAQEEVLYNFELQLNEIMVQPLDYKYKLPEQIPVNRSLDFEELIGTVTMVNPELLAAQRERNVAYLEWKELMAQRLPTLNFNAGLLYSTSESEGGFVIANQSQGYTYGLTANFRVFDGFRQSRQAQIAKINIQNSEYRAESLRVQLESDLRKAYKNYTNNIYLYDLESENLEVARENLDIAQERYEIGITTPLELREAQRNAIEAESRLLNAAYSTKIAEIELFRLSGRILNTYLHQSN